MHSFRCIFKSWAAAPYLLLLGVASVLWAAGPAGEIRIEVKDPSGAAMEASGKLENLASGTDRSFQTDAQGSYTLKSVPSGRYRLELSRSGFATQSLLDRRAVRDSHFARRSRWRSARRPTKWMWSQPRRWPESILLDCEIPAPVQTATARDIEESGALNLADFLNRRLDSVYVNEIQGNPFQPDVNYRGYTASPLLGTPQGLSVYMDGVRLNQPFGDVVSWDLIPRIAISEVSLMPGIESDLRTQHAGRRALDRDQGRPPRPGHRASS